MLGLLNTCSQKCPETTILVKSRCFTQNIFGFGYKYLYVLGLGIKVFDFWVGILGLSLNIFGIWVWVWIYPTQYQNPIFWGINICSKVKLSKNIHIFFLAIFGTFLTNPNKLYIFGFSLMRFTKR